MVYVIVVNWNGWRDTIECLESVLRLDYEQYRVIVCDNCSADGSLDRIADWAQGAILAGCSNPVLQHLTAPPLTKPISFLRLDRGEIVDLASRPEKLILVQTGENLGFAGGNNVGLRLALSDAACEFAWLLNNDTVVEPHALRHLEQRMQERPDAGICGSTLLNYYNPGIVQAFGGSIYNRWLARVGHIGSGESLANPPSRESVEKRMQYVVGASMFVRSSFLQCVGLLDERYFLYFEEIDWATRGQGAFALAYCPESVLYHKEGASAGTSAVNGKARSELCERFASRNRILFTRKYFPKALVVVILALAASAVHRLITGKPRRLLALLKGMAAGLAQG